MSGETTIGSIIGFLRLNDDDWSATVDRAQADVERLSGTSASPRVSADTTEASARIASVQEQADRLDHARVTVPITAQNTDAIRSIQSLASQTISADRRMSSADLARSRAAEAVTRAQNSLASATNRAAQAQAELEKLKKPDSSGSVDEIARAEQRLAAARRDEDLATQHLNNTTAAQLASLDRLKKKVDDNKQSVSLLGTAIAAIGPAIVPLAAGAAGLGLAFGGMGAAGFLAFKGIQAEMADGSQQGQVYTGLIRQLRVDLAQLETTAATGVLKPFQTVVSDLQPKMPLINAAVAAFAGTLGAVAIPAADGITTAFIKLTPMMEQVGQYAVGLAQDFDQFAHGNGLTVFGSYATTVMPQVIDLIKQLVPLVVNLTGSFAPMGAISTQALTLLTQALNMIPTPILQILSSGAVSVYLAFQAWKGLQSIVAPLASGLGSLSGAMDRVGASGMASRLQAISASLGATSVNADEAAVSSDALAASSGAASTSTGELAATSSAAAGGTGELAANAAAASADVDALAASADAAAASEDAMGASMALVNPVLAGIAAVVGIATFAWSQYEAHQQSARMAQEQLTQAIQASGGVINTQIQQLVAQQLVASGVVKTLEGYGASYQQIMGAALKGGPAMDSLNATIAKNATVTEAASGAAGGMGKTTTAIAKDAQGALGAVSSLNGKISDQVAQTKTSIAVAKAASSSTRALTADQKDQILSQESLTNATQAQRTAINQLNTALDAEISRQNQLEGGLIGIASARQQLIATLKKNKSTTDLNTAAGLANAQQITNMVGQLQSYRDTQIKTGTSIADATSAYRTQGAQLLQLIGHMDGADSSTYQLAQRLLKLPKDVTAKVGVSGTSVAASQLKGLSTQAKALGDTRIEIPTGTPNAKNTAQLLNNISDAALSANGKSVTIPTDSPKAVATKLELDDITGAAVTANGKSVTIPTKTLRTPQTLAEIQSILDRAQNKTMTTTANMAHYQEVLGEIESVQAAAQDKTFTITARFASQNAGGSNLARHGLPAYASGTTSSKGGPALVGENGVELVLGPQIRDLRAGSTVLNNRDTMAALGGGQEPLRALGGVSRSSSSAPIQVQVSPRVDIAGGRMVIDQDSMGKLSAYITDVTLAQSNHSYLMGAMG